MICLDLSENPLSLVMVIRECFEIRLTERRLGEEYEQPLPLNSVYNGLEFVCLLEI
jgi:hypothetical protein